VNDPFYTVHATTNDEKKGQKVLEKNCMSCHNTPNVFGNMLLTEIQDSHPISTELGFPHHTPQNGQRIAVRVL